MIKYNIRTRKIRKPKKNQHDLAKKVFPLDVWLEKSSRPFGNDISIMISDGKIIERLGILSGSLSNLILYPLSIEGLKLNKDSLIETF